MQRDLFGNSEPRSRRRRFAGSIAAVGLAAALSGCIVPGRVPTVQATPTALPTEIGGGVSDTPVPSETPADTPTPRLTRTPLPTASQTPTSTPIFTSTPFPTATVVASPAPATTPTNTPVLLTATPVCGYDSSLVKDVTIPAGTQVPAGTTFTKSWKIMNSGCQHWTDGTHLAFVGGTQMGGPDRTPIAHLKGDNTEIVSIDFVAPAKKGNYTGRWQLETPDGLLFGAIFTVQIRVV